MADGDDLVIGNLFNSSTGITGLQRTSGSGDMVFQVTSAVTSVHAIHGQSASPGTGAGVIGTSVDGDGVRGISESHFGVSGGSSTEAGVRGTSKSGVGVRGMSESSAGVLGQGQPGVQGHGVRGGSGVVGVAGSKKGTGVEGQADGGTGVSGTVTTGTAVFGQAPQGIALWGQSATKQGVLGQSQLSTGVEGTSISGIGVRAETDSNFALYASAPNGMGVNGEGVYGVRGASPSFIGVFGKCPNGYAGYFEGNVLIVGDLTKTGVGSSVAVRFPDRSYRQLHSIECPESWFEDFGEGRLVKGKAEVKIDTDFAKTVDLKKRYYVFVTPHSTKISGLAVVARLPGRFRVEHADGGNGTFSYRIIAKRADVNVPRLKRMKLPDSNLITKDERGQVRARPKRSARR
jgi:hypothetical protein